VPQTAEYLLDKGLLDLVVPRSFLKGALFEIIDFYKVSGGGGGLVRPAR
jgi:acetyl-CoA carboxylase carboxyl transferase subunit beta